MSYRFILALTLFSFPCFLRADYIISSNIDSASVPHTLTNAFQYQQAEQPFNFDVSAFFSDTFFLHTSPYIFSQDITFGITGGIPDYGFYLSCYLDLDLQIEFLATGQTIDIGSHQFRMGTPSILFIGGCIKGTEEGALILNRGSSLTFFADFTDFLSPITLNTRGESLLQFTTGSFFRGNIPLHSSLSLLDKDSEVDFITYPGPTLNYGGEISGIGLLTKQESGTLILGANINPFSGSVDVQGGTLILQHALGDVGSSLTQIHVEEGASMQAQGDIYSQDIINDGLFQVPLAQNLTAHSDFDNVGFLGVNVDISAGSSRVGVLNVHGNFNFNSSNIYVFSQDVLGIGAGPYTFLTSSSDISGTPSNIISDDPKLIFTLDTTNPQNFVLNVTESTPYNITSTDDHSSTDHSLTAAFATHQLNAPFIFRMVALGPSPSFAHASPYTFNQNIEFQTNGYTSSDTISISGDMNIGNYGLIVNTATNFNIEGTITSSITPPPGFFFLRQQDSGIITFGPSADLSGVFSNIALSEAGTLIFNTPYIPQGSIDTGAGYLIFDIEGDATYGTTDTTPRDGFSGRGTITKRGTGSLTVNSSYNPFLGKIEVEEGSLVFTAPVLGQEGETGGDINIHPGSLFGVGQGTIFSSNVINQGVFFPLYLTMVHNVTNQAGSFFLVLPDILAKTSEISPSLISLTTTEGAIQFEEGSSLVLVNIFSKSFPSSLNSIAGQKKILFLQAPTISGTPDIFSDIAFFKVYYSAEGTPGVSMQGYLILQPTVLNVLNSGATDNEKRVAQYLDELDLTLGTGLEGFGLFKALANNALGEGEPATLADLYAALALGTNPNQVNHALNQMHTGIYKGLSFSQENNTKVVMQSITERLNDVYLNQCAPLRDVKKKKEWRKRPKFKQRCGNREESLTVWGEWIGDFLIQEGVYGNKGSHTLTNGFLVGVDAPMPYKPLTIGGGFSYTHSDVKWSASQAEVDINSVYGTVYEKFHWDGFFIDMALLGGWSHYKGHRKIDIFLNEVDGSIVDFTTRAHTSHQGWQWDGLLKTGYNFHVAKTNIMPYFLADYLYLKEGGFEEKGANYLNLNVKKTEYQRMRLETGFYTSSCVCRPGYRFIPEIKLSGIYEKRIGGKWYTESFVDQPGYMRIEGISPGHLWLFSPGAGLTFSLFKTHLDLTLRYNGEFSGNFDFMDNTAHFEILYKF